MTPTVFIFKVQVQVLTWKRIKYAPLICWYPSTD
jgi:hypothetical protein